MTFSFHPEADDEFIHAVEYYEDCDFGLGIDFSREIHAAIQNIIDYPMMWPEIDDEVHLVVARSKRYASDSSFRGEGPQKNQQ